METNFKGIAGSLRLLRKSNIISIIGIIIAIVGAVVLGVGAGVGGDMINAGSDVSTGAILAVGGGGLVTIAGLVLSVIAGIMGIVALSKTASAHTGYKNALILTVLSIVVSLAAAFITMPETVISLVDTVSIVIAALVVFFVIKATVEILGKKGDTAVSTIGESVCKLYMMSTAVIVVASIAALVPALAMICAVVVIAAGIVQLVALFKFIGFLGKSATVLEN